MAGCICGGAKKPAIISVRKQAGFLKSPLFGKSFRLVQNRSEHGLPEFKLEVG